MKKTAIPSFFKHDLSVLLSFKENVFSSETYNSKYNTILRFEYWKSFWNSPIDDKLYNKSLKKLVKFFEESFDLEDYYLLNLEEKVFYRPESKDKFISEIETYFKDPSLLGILFISKYNLIIVINYDLSIILFYELESEGILSILEIFSKIGMIN